MRDFFDRFKATAGGVQARFLRGEFSAVLHQLAANGVQADAILLDLGVSSMQLDRPERGFSYSVDAPLDMRMDRSLELSARTLLNESTEQDLATIFKRYGEERYARPIARAIVRRRAAAAARAHVRARRHDQAAPSRRRPASATGTRPSACSRRLRIAVNDELGALEAALPGGGRRCSDLVAASP